MDDLLSLVQHEISKTFGESSDVLGPTLAPLLATALAPALAGRLTPGLREIVVAETRRQSDRLRQLLDEMDGRPAQAGDDPDAHRATRAKSRTPSSTKEHRAIGAAMRVMTFVRDRHPVPVAHTSIVTGLRPGSDLPDDPERRKAVIARVDNGHSKAIRRLRAEGGLIWDRQAMTYTAGPEG